LITKWETGELSTELMIGLAYRHFQDKDLDIAHSIVTFLLKQDSTNKQTIMLAQLMGLKTKEQPAPGPKAPEDTSQKK
jgi:hypothetical protein